MTEVGHGQPTTWGDVLSPSLDSSPRVGRQIRRTRRQLLGMFLDLFHHQLDRLFELRIAPLHDQIGPVIDLDIRIDAAIFNQPLTCNP